LWNDVDEHTAYTAVYLILLATQQGEGKGNANVVLVRGMHRLRLALYVHIESDPFTHNALVFDT
jgi:hypothetical protein